MNKQQMAAKEYLMQAYHVDASIRSKVDQIACLNDLACKVTQALSDMPGSPNRNVHKTEDIIVKIVSLQEELKSKMQELVDLKDEISKTIEGVEESEFRTVLELRYLSHLKWEDISDTMYCGVDNVFKIHRKALDKVYESLQ